MILVNVLILFDCINQLLFFSMFECVFVYSLHLLPPKNSKGKTLGKDCGLVCSDLDLLNYSLFKDCDRFI